MNTNNKMLKSVCEKIYQIVSENDGKVDRNSFLKCLQERGILSDDPRIHEFLKKVKQYQSKNKCQLDKESFIDCISQNISIIEDSFTGNNIIPNFHELTDDLQTIYEKCKVNEDGKMADYIPQLAKQNPKHFGLSVCTISGQRINIGDTDVQFCVQSCCKPINYCLALEEHDKEYVHKHVGREPSGSEFNALKLNTRGLPHNPLINSGAIMTCSLIQNTKPASDRFDYVTEMWEKMAGNFSLGYSNSVYLSERMSADRNFALAYFMNENNAFPENTNLLDVLEFYFQCCSLKINTNALSVVAATLANGGVCPLTGKQVISPETVKHCLSMMYSCGMYDYSGEFAFKIGLPAKSGVAGGIFVVIPNVMGICTYSPRLDQYGNSIRGVQFFTELTKTFNFHNFDNLKNTDHGKKDPRERKDKDDITSEEIIKYSSLGDVSALKRVSITNGDFSHGDYDNRTPLHLACSNGHLNVVKYLIEQGNLKDINPIDRWGGTPYDDAVRENHVEVTKYLTTKNGMSGDDLQK